MPAESEPKKRIQFDTDGEVLDLTEDEKEGTPSTPYSLAELTEDNGIVEVAKRFDGLNSRWKLDWRIAEITTDPDSPKYSSLTKLVELIEVYTDKLVELDTASETLSDNESLRRLYELSNFLPSACIFLTVLIEASNDRIQALHAALAVVMPLLNVYLLRLKDVDFKIGDTFHVKETLWTGLKESRATVPPLQAEAQELYAQIRGYFGELGLTWYLREHVFADAMTHIVDVYHDPDIAIQE